MNEMPTSAPKAFASTVNSVLSSDADLLLTSTRNHWSFMNSVHWVLDVAFPVDDSRIRQGHAQHNLTILLRLALKPLRKEISAQIGISARRKRAGRKTDYHLKVFPQQDVYAQYPTLACPISVPFVCYNSDRNSDALALASHDSRPENT